MPTIIIPNPGIQESVIRPSISAIVEDVLNTLRIPKNEIELRYINHNGDVRIAGTAVGEERNNYASFSGSSRIWVEVNEDIFVDGYKTDRPDKIDSQPLFCDSGLGVSIHPFMSSSQSTIKIRYKTHSYDEVRQKREWLAAIIAQLRDGIQHRIDFSIVPADFILCLLQDIWIKRKLGGVVNDKFEDYISKGSSGGLTTISDASGVQTSLAYKRRMGRVNGYFIVSDLPEKPTYQDNENVWELNVEYRVNFDIPTMMQVSYPIMVYQRYLHRAFLKGLTRETDIRDRSSNLSDTQKAASMTDFGQEQGLNNRRDLIINIPSVDHFEPSVVPRNTATVFIALLSIQRNQKTPLFNLGNLGKLIIDRDILNFIKDVEYPYLNQFFKSFFMLSLYEDYDLKEPGALYCDENLDVYTTVDLDIRRMYRVRLSLVADPAVLPADAFRRIYPYPRVAVKTITTINNAVRDNTDFFDLYRSRNWEPWKLGPMWGQVVGREPLPNVIYDCDKPLEPGIGFGDGYVYPDGPEQLPIEFAIDDNVSVDRHGMRTVQVNYSIVRRND